MSIIAAILIGSVVGIIAKFLTPGKDPRGFSSLPLSVLRDR